MNYYLKEIVSNPLRAPTGRAIEWDNIGDDYGLIETGDEELIKTLESYIEKARGGVIRIDEERYKELLKKKLDSSSPPKPSRRMSDPPEYPALVPIDAAAAIERGLLGKGTPPKVTSTPTIKLGGFSGTAPEGAKQAAPPPPPSGDAKVNRPTPKKLVPPVPPS